MSEYKPDDLVCFKSDKTPYRMTYISPNGLIHFNWSKDNSVKNDAGETPENISRPELAVGMWVRVRKGWSAPSPKRIGEIRDNMLVFDAHVTKAPGREGTIVVQSSGVSRTPENWIPVADPDAPNPSKKEETVIEYLVGDLARLPRDSDRFVVTHAGMGKPRGGIHLRSVVEGRSAQNWNEEGLIRATIKRGDWVRCINGDHWGRHRVVGFRDETLHCDRRELLDGTFADVFFSIHKKFWVAVETPKEFEPAGTLTMKEQHSKEMHAMRDEANRLAEERESLNKQLVGEREATSRLVGEARELLKKLTWWQDEADRRRDSASLDYSKLQNEVNRLESEKAVEVANTRKARSDIEFMRTLLKNKQQEWKLLLGNYSATVAQRDKERYKKERAREQIHRLEAEVLDLHRQLKPQPKVVM